MKRDTQTPWIRAVGGLLIIVAILVAFLYQLTARGETEGWLVVLVSLLGLAAGAAVLGSEAVRTGYRVLRGLRGGKR
ncbi:hypothetical protein ACFQMA_13915 [Halosimplex aquaticum]|uniref:Uncharacterized protein n=1 Tax=Halosimplex aquaticum TaxID=3026162 RepID=A0ABD5Y3N3_9EURY|nr:hypothetical protein [Halosimplex aquaticum]